MQTPLTGVLPMSCLWRSSNKSDTSSEWVPESM